MTKILIKLEGYLEKLYPEGVSVKARTIREALGLLSTFKGFRPTEGRRHYVRVSDLYCIADLDKPDPPSTLILSPIMGGAGGGRTGKAFGQILIGALLIALSFVGGGPLTFKIGVALILGAMLQLMTPRAPVADPTSGDKKSRFISGSKNTVEAGTPIPLLYGRMQAGGHYLSFDIDAEDYEP